METSRALGVINTNITSALGSGQRACVVECIAVTCDMLDDEWDKQMKACAAAGKLDAMNARALAEHEAGLSEEWP